MRLHVWAPGFSVFQGGIGGFSQALAVGLRDIGHDVHLFGKVDKPGRWNDFDLWGAGHSPAELRTLHFASGLIAACVKHKPDFVVSTHLNFGPAARLVKQLFGIRYALIVHGIDVHDALPPLRRAALRAADMIIVISGWTRQRLFDSVEVEARRVEILPNTVDERRFTVAGKPQRLVERYKLRPEERVVLTVARLDPEGSVQRLRPCIAGAPGRSCGVRRSALYPRRQGR